MTPRYDSTRIDHARLNLESCRIKVEKLEVEVRAARTAGSEVKAAKLEGHYFGALAAHDAAQAELDAAEAAPRVPFVEPTEHVSVSAGLASGDGQANP